MAANKIRVILSVVPIFFFMVVPFALRYKVPSPQGHYLLHKLHITQYPYLVAVKQEFFPVLQFFQ